MYPDSGSTAGGTLLSISGNNFDETISPAQVFVGGTIFGPFVYKHKIYQLYLRTISYIFNKLPWRSKQNAVFQEKWIMNLVLNILCSPHFDT